VLNFAGTVMDDIDAIEGGAGNDTIVASDSGDVTLRGGDGADIITGGAGADRIEGGKGKDTIQGAGGDDTIVISGTDAQFDTIDGGAGAENTISVTGSAAVTLAAFNATASSIHTWNGNGKHVIGDGNNNVLNFAGLTTIEGSGILYIDGAAGDDTIVGTDIDTNDLRGGAGNDDLTGGALQDTLNGGAGADDITAGAENDTIVITGAEAEFDTIDGGGGDDTILVTGSAAVTLDAFDATASSIEYWFGNKKGVLGNDEANVFDFSGLDNPANIGVIDGGDGNDDITGSDEADEIRGGTGDDTLDGFDGNDTLNGGIGADDISGGAGNDTIVISGTEGASDTLDGGADTDTLSLTSATVTLKNFDATASLIEQLQGKNTALRGDGDNNSFDLSGLAVVSGLKSVDGGTGNDTIIGVDLDTYSDDLRGNSGIDRLTGGKGDDKLAGGSDDDTFVFDTTDFDHDTIADFGSGFDVIEFDNAVFADFTAVQNAMEQVGDDTVITLDADNTITLTDVVASQLTTNDFTFV
jgi:Ca2+-binding RTX toxin-like protein